MGGYWLWSLQGPRVAAAWQNLEKKKNQNQLSTIAIFPIRTVSKSYPGNCLSRHMPACVWLCFSLVKFYPFSFWDSLASSPSHLDCKSDTKLSTGKVSLSSYQQPHLAEHVTKHRTLNTLERCAHLDLKQQPELERARKYLSGSSA